MKNLHPVAGKSIGVLILLTGLLVITKEVHLWAGVNRILFAPIMLLTLIMTFYVSTGRKVFVMVAVALSVINLLWNDNAIATLNAGFATAAFITVFFAALTTLKYAAATSPGIQSCGRFLAQQPPGRRYAALTVGGQMFGLLLNYGAISLLGSMTMVNASQEKNEEIRNHRIRRMLLAIQRGFISTLPWSPLSFATAISTTLIHGTSWGVCVLPGLVNGAIIAGVGWFLDTVFKPRLSSGVVPTRKIEGNWSAVLPLLLLLLLLVILLGTAYFLTGIRVLALVMFIVPLLSLIWVAIQARGNNPLQQVRQRSSDFVLVQLASFRGELVLLMMAGYIGTVASPILSELMVSMHVDLAAMPVWSILISLVWFIPLAGQLGMNPILAVSLIAPVLPDAAQLGISPIAIVVALTGGWVLSGVSSPFTATTMMVGNFAGVSSSHVGLRWNGIYTLLCGVILSVWVVFYAGIV